MRGCFQRAVLTLVGWLLQISVRCESPTMSDQLVSLKEMVEEAKSVKRELDAVRKTSDRLSSDAVAMLASLDASTESLALDIQSGLASASASVTAYSDVVVFVQQRLEGGVSNKTGDVSLLLEATAEQYAAELGRRVTELEAENAELRSSLETSASARSEAEARCDDELYRLARELEQHEREQKRLREADSRRNEERSRLEAEKAALVKLVEALDRRAAYECAAAVDHDREVPTPGSLAIVRAYEPEGKEGKLWWNLAEVVQLIEGEGSSPDDLLSVRRFRDYIKSPSKYSLETSFERDWSAPLDVVRRDALAYIGVELDGAGDSGADFFGSRSSAPKPKDDLRRATEPKPPKRKGRGAVSISEHQKRDIAARLARDDAAWDRRERLSVHSARPIVLDAKIAWQREALNGSLEFVFGLVLEPPNDDRQCIVAALDPVLPADPILNDTILEERFSLTTRNSTLSTDDVIFVDLPVHTSGGRKKDNGTKSWTIKSADRKEVALVLKQAAARWWRKLMLNEIPEPRCRPPHQDEQEASHQNEQSGPLRDEQPDPHREKPHLNLTTPESADSEHDRPLATPQQVAAARQQEENLLARAEMPLLESTRLDTLKRKLLWLVEVVDLGLLSAQEASSLRADVLIDFQRLQNDIVPIGPNETLLVGQNNESHVVPGN